MAIQMEDNIYGLPVNAYIKIIWTNILEIGWEHWDKLYSITAIINYYTDNSKINLYKQENEYLEMRECELTLENIYKKIMSLDKFIWAKEV